MKRMPLEKKQRRDFLRWLAFISLALFVILLSRLVQIMGLGYVNNVNLADSSRDYYQRSSVLTAKRGTIYDMNGRPLALDATSYSLYAVLTSKWGNGKKDYVNEENREKIAKVLAEHINLSEEKILSILETKKVNQVEFGNAGANLTYAQMKAIQDEKLPGIQFVANPGRSYPNGIFASHILGYAQYKQAEDLLDSRLVGQMGLEKSFDSTLTGKNGMKLSGDSQKNSEQVTASQAADGRSIYTTLNTKLQAYLENLMSQAEKKYKPEALTAMLVEPETGKILAASQRPTFNPQTREGIDKMWQNLLVEKPFEPGSTMKVLTLAAAIEEGVFNPSGIYTSGAISIDGAIIRDYNYVGWGDISQLDGVARSSNVLFVKLVGEIGYDKWKEYMLSFGLLQKPNSPFENEATGSMTFDYPVEKASTGFGQSIQVTPWQMVQAYTAIASDGTMKKLQLIDRYENEKHEIVKVKTENIGQIISNKTAQMTRQYLTRVVEDAYGTGQMYKIEGEEIAAKTGTGQIYDDKTGGYLNGGLNYTYSVVGFAPANEPKYILYLTIEKPTAYQDVNDGHTMLSEIFVPFLKRALGSTATSQNTNDTATLPDVTGQASGNGQQSLYEIGFLNVKMLGEGPEITGQWPSAGVNISTNRTIYLTASGNNKMPDFSGLSRQEAVNLAKFLNLTVQGDGEGFVVGQSLAPGSAINTSETLVLQYQQP